MDIASIQKRKFLNNIYKLMYSEGKIPSDLEVRKIFSKYFTINEPGKPINVEYYNIETMNQTNVDMINELMANSLFNLEILYDAIFENNQQIFSTVTSLNNRLEGLRVKRKELESKVDDILFANSNTDGFFYSFLENFNTVSNIDLTLTSAYVDLTNNHAMIPKVSNITSDEIVSNSFISNNVTFNTSINSQMLVENSFAENFDFVFDGLNDTYWSYDLESDILGIASITFVIPVNTNYSISSIEGSILTGTPCSVHVKAIPSNISKDQQIRVKDSKGDYSRFSFSIPADFYSTIYVTLVKNEPDFVSNSGTGLYRYSFGLRELSIFSSYYDQRAVLISKPISIPTSDNSNLVISAVSLESKDQIPDGTSLSYYVAADVSGAVDASSFNWTRVNTSSDSNRDIVQITPINFKIKSIGPIGSDFVLIPTNTSSLNINELNPATLPFSNKQIYRICSLNSEDKYITPYIISDSNCYRHYNLILNQNVNEVEIYRSLETWSDYINGRLVGNINVDLLKNQTTSINPGLFMASVGLLEGRLLCDKSISINHMVTKSNPNFNLGIYLNNIMIADLPVGVNQKNIEWNFVEGVNNISITYDKNQTGNISFNIMSGKSITDYGSLFLDYFNYLDPIQFKTSNIENMNVFTIDNIYGNYEILSSKMITNTSSFRYYTIVSEQVNSIRYRVDMNRFGNPLQSPVVDAVRLKFKHNDLPL